MLCTSRRCQNKINPMDRIIMVHSTGLQEQTMAKGVDTNTVYAIIGERRTIAYLVRMKLQDEEIHLFQKLIQRDLMIVLRSCR